MKAETFFVPLEAPSATVNRAAYVAAGALALIILGLYWPTIQSIVAIWMRSGTYTHGFVVLPVSLWLIWRDRESLRGLAARPYPMAIAGLALAGLVWLSAQLSAILSVSQFALLGMVQLAVVAVLGTSLARRLAFPLAFLVFAVPFGEFLIPWLIDRTAEATVFLLQLTGVPVFREGNHLQIPSGRWSVVDACSGLRYLIASLAGGTLYAYLRFRSTGKRALFIALSLALPLLANWIRAYAIILLAHLTNNKLGANIDHIIYGWIFFGVVICLLFWAGSYWHDDPAPAGAATVPAPPVAQGDSHPIRSVLVTAAICLAVAAIWPPLYHVLGSPSRASVPALHDVPGANGWTAVPSTITSWKPVYVKASNEAAQTFSKDGQTVGLHIAYYRNQTQGAELISSKNALVYAEDETWTLVTAKAQRLEANGRSIDAQAGYVLGSGQKIAVRQWYWIAGHVTGNDYVAKFLQVLCKATGQPDDSAAVVIYTILPATEHGSGASLNIFSSEMSPAITQMLEQTKSKR